MTILLLVAAWSTRSLDTDLSLETVLVAVTDLGAQPIQAALALGTVGVDLTFRLTQTSTALVTRGTLATGTPGGDPHTSLLWCRHSGKKLGTRTLDTLVVNLAQGVGSTGTLLLARVDALEVDADLVRGTVLVSPAARTADSVTADLTGRTLLA